jgi:hypothetical protein
MGRTQKGISFSPLYFPFFATPSFLFLLLNKLTFLFRQPKNSYYKSYWGAGITWITDWCFEEKAFTGIDYDIKVTMAILVVIPPWQDRAKMTDSV